MHPRLRSEKGGPLRKRGPLPPSFIIDMKKVQVLSAAGILLLVLMAGCGTSGQRSFKRHAVGDVKLDFGTDDDAVFSRPVSISHDRDSIYVVDAEENEIRVFSKTGTFMRALGRKGQGPGEFDSPADLDISGDKIYVTDRFNKRVQILDRKGNYLGGFKVPFTPEQICVLSGELIVLSHLPLGVEGPEPMVHGFSENGRLIWEQAPSYYSGERVYDTFRNFIVMVKDRRDDVLVIHKSDERRILRFDKGGRPGTPVRVTEDYALKRISLPLKGSKRNVSGFCWDASFDGDLLGLLASNSSGGNDLGPGRTIFLIAPDGLMKDIIDLPAVVTRIDMDGDDIYAVDTENSLRIFRFTMAAEDPVVLSSLAEALPREGTPVLLVFFSASCPSCYDDLLEMIHFVKKNGLAVRVVGISGDSKADLEAFMGKHSVGCSVVRDERGKLRRSFRVDLVPYKIVLQGDTVVYRDNDYLESSERRRKAGQCLIDLAGR